MSNGLLDRVGALESKNLEIVETLQAVLQVVGPGEVQAKVGETRRAQMAKAITDALKAGKLEKREKVTEDCLVVGTQFTKQGQPIFPGRFQLYVKEIAPEAKEAILGLPLGAPNVGLKDGTKLLVSEIYGPPTPKTDAPAAPAKKTRKKKS